MVYRVWLHSQCFTEVPLGAKSPVVTNTNSLRPVLFSARKRENISSKCDRNGRCSRRF